MAKIDLNKALFFDIETHYVIPWDQRSEALQRAFIGHYYDSDTYESPEEHFHEIAGLHGEFSQCICIVFGYLNNSDVVAGPQFRTMECHGTNEVEILTKTAKIFSYFQDQGYFLCGHNIKRCDIPYLVKRYILQGMEVPDFINSYGVKPWEQVHIDSMELWQFGAPSRVALETACAAMGIPCKTDELGGGNLYQYSIEEMPWDDLVHYCTEDVVSNYRMVEYILKYYNTSD